MRNGPPVANWKKSALLLSICGSFFMPAAYALNEPADTANASAAAPSAGAQGPVEEVTVEAHKLKLSKLRMAIKKSVHDFYDAFNKANTVPGYDTHCSDEKPPGSYIAHLVCTPRFFDDANEQATQGFFYGYATIPAASLIMVRQRGYKEHLQELIHNDPRVRQAALDSYALAQQYEAVRNEKVKAN